jgi:hypothetical protein
MKLNSKAERSLAGMAQPAGPEGRLPNESGASFRPDAAFN